MGVIKDFPFNMNYSCAENLLEVPEDAVEMRKGVDWLQEKIQNLAGADNVNDNVRDKVQETILLSQLSGLARIVGDIKLAEVSLLKAIDILKEFKREDQIFAMNLRLGMIHQAKGSFTSAEDIYHRSLEKIESCADKKLNKYHDVILHQYGRLKFEQGFFQDALDYFLSAYEARIVKGDLEQLSATEYAIAQTRKKLGL